MAGAVDVEQVLDEHAERRPPVADVVLAPHVVAEEAEHAGQRVADERGAQVADVHLLGHVGRRVVDDAPSRGVATGSTPSRASAESAATCAGHEVVGQRQVDEARAR